MSGLRGAGWVLVLVVGLVVAAGPARSSVDGSPSVQDQTASAGADRNPLPGVSGSTTSAPVTIQAAGRGGPYINFRDGHAVPARFTGDVELAAVLQDGRARPTALASGDFDDDGMPDVVCAFEFNGRGIVSIHRGNVDLLFPNAPDAQRRRAEGTLVEEAFLPEARVFATPHTPDLLGVGDFDADGRLDLVVASLGGTELDYHRGDGAGSLHAATGIPLPGRVTALTAGDVNRRDWMNDLLVGVETDAGPRLLVMEGPNGAAHDDPEVLVLPEAATQIVLGQFDREAPIDYAVAAGRSVLVVRGRDRHPTGARATLPPVPPARIQQVELPERVQSLSVGRFDDDRTKDLAVLDAAGFLRIAPTAEPERLLSAKPTLQHAALNSTARLVKTKVSSRTGDDLITVAPSSLNVQAVPGGADYEPAAHSTTLEVSGRPVAVLPMRLNGDALDDLVVLTEQPAGLSTITTDAATVITVTNTDDFGLVGTLRVALTTALGTSGPVEIRFNIPGPPPYVIQVGTFALPDAAGPLLIDGTSQPGFSGRPLVFVDGSLSVNNFPSDHGLRMSRTGTVVRGLAFTNWSDSSTGKGLAVGGADHFIEMNSFGVGFDGTAAPNRIGIQVNSDGESITIGGTAIAAANLSSGNLNSQVLIYPYDNAGGMFTIENVQVLGNAIGIAPAGPAGCLHSPSSGIHLFLRNNGSMIMNTLIGSPTGAGGNTIACQESGGVLIRGSEDGIGMVIGTAVLANRIGTDLSGTVSLPGGLGVLLQRAHGNQVGSTFSGSGNLIVPNVQSAGVELSEGSGNRVDDNLIGVNAAGTAPLGPGCALGIWLLEETGSDIDDNVIGHCDRGIDFNQSSGNLVTSNSVGTDRSGTIDLGNSDWGIDLVLSDSNEIGNQSLGGNRIAFNGGAGIRVKPACLGNRIGRNAIYENGGLGIDLLDGSVTGVTPNDPGDTDTGGNNLQNFPVLSFAGTTGLDINLVGTLDSEPNRTYDIELFSNINCDPSGYGEGVAFLGSTPVTTDGTGSGSFDVTLGGGIPTGYGMTATATSPDGDTSEFSACLGAVGVSPFEAEELRWTPGGELEWEAAPSVLGYNLYRSNSVVAPALSDSGLDSCLQLTTSNTMISQDEVYEAPEPGGVFIFLVTAYNGITEGPAGDGTFGPRQLDSAGDCGIACLHDVCLVGAPLSPVCSGCVAQVCNQFPDCCTKSWDQECLLASDLLCGTTCL